MVVQENLVGDRTPIMLMIPIWDIVIILVINIMQMVGGLLISKMEQLI